MHRAALAHGQTQYKTVQHKVSIVPMLRHPVLDRLILKEQNLHLQDVGSPEQPAKGKLKNRKVRCGPDTKVRL